MRAFCIRSSVGIAVAASVAGAGSGAAQAQVVNFPGVVVPVCVLVPTAGVLALSASGTVLGSEETGGAAAGLAVTSTGGAATVSFTAPTMAPSLSLIPVPRR